MTIRQQIGEEQRVLSLDSAATDYTRYVKTQAVRSWWWSIITFSWTSCRLQAPRGRVVQAEEDV